MEEYFTDLSEAKELVYIYIRDSLDGDENFIKRFGKIISDLKNKGVKVLLASNMPHAVSMRKLSVKKTDRNINNLTIIDKKVFWYGAPVSNSITQPTIRLYGASAGKVIFGLLKLHYVFENSSIGKFCDYVREHKRCPLCGKKMEFKDMYHKYRNFICTDKNCGYKTPIDVDFINEYLRNVHVDCPECHSSLEVHTGRNGAYIRCKRTYDSHYISLNDL